MCVNGMELGFRDEFICFFGSLGFGYNISMLIGYGMSRNANWFWDEFICYMRFRVYTVRVLG